MNNEAGQVNNQLTRLVFGDDFGAYPHEVDLKSRVDDLRKFLISHHEDGDDGSHYVSFALLLEYTLWLEQTLNATERCLGWWRVNHEEL